MAQKRLKDNWLEEYKLILRNPIYFLEVYWNQLYKDEQVELSDKEKQEIYDQYKMKPFIKSFEELRELEKARKEANEKSIKDWEGFL